MAVFVFPFFLMGQNLQENQLADQVNNLKGKLQAERSRVNALQARMMVLENGFRALSDSLQKQISANLELQAQNERAVNLALDEFSKKFEEQNKTMDGVKAKLEEQMSKQVMYYAFALIIFMVIMVIGIRWSSAQALRKQEKSWNEFNEYIIKNK